MLLVLLSVGFAQVPPPIINGYETQDYPQTVTLWSQTSNGYGYNFCSGTLIAPTWVLTAAHCVKAFADNEAQGMNQHYVMVGYDLNSRSGVQEYAAIKSYTAHPQYDSNNLHNDIGIVELKTAIKDIAPMPVNKTAPTNAMKGQDLRYVGWGITSDTGQDASKKHYADIPFYQFDTYFIYGYDPTDRQNVCSGDSGGSVLKILANNVYELAAVNSFVSDNDNTPCLDGYTGGTRVDQYISWIEQYTPVYSSTETDTDTDSDSDTDADSDTDTDTDTDTTPATDSGSLSNGDRSDLDDPARPADVGENYTNSSGFCSAASGGGWWAMGALALAFRRRKA